MNQRGQRAAVWLGVLAYGYAPGPGIVAGNGDKHAARALGVLALATECWAWWQDSRLLRNPDTMNAWFKTGGALSGVRSDTEAKVVRARGYE